MPPSPAPALAPPCLPPAPHSLWELGVVEGGLQDAGREHWGHRRALHLRGAPCPVPTHSITHARGPWAVPSTSGPPHTSHPRGLSPGGWAVPHPSGSCWAGSRRSAPGEAAATCKERQQCWAAGAPSGACKCHPFAHLGAQKGVLGLTCALLPTRSGVQLGMGTGGVGGAMLCPPSLPPEQTDTHADLSTSCRIFFTESLMLKAMLLRMFLK